MIASGAGSDLATHTVFISHTRRASALATQLAEFLEARGFQAWLAGHEIEPGERWESPVLRALGEAEGVVLIIEPGSPSAELRREWSMVLESSWDDQGTKSIVPLLIDDASTPPFLRGVEGVHLPSGTEDLTDCFAEVSRRLTKRPDHEEVLDVATVDLDELYERMETAIGELARDESDDDVLRADRDVLHAQLSQLQKSTDLDPLSLATFNRALGMLDVALGDHEAARDAFKSAIAAQQESDEPRTELAPMHNSLGRVLLSLEEPAEAAEHFRLGLELQREEEDADSAAAATLQNLGIALAQTGDFGEAKQALEESLEIGSRELGASHPSVIATTMLLGHAMLEDDDAEAARQLYEQLLGAGAEDQAAIATMSLGLGKSLRELGDLEQSRELLEKSLEINRKIYGDDDFRVAGVCYQLGLTLDELGELGSAVEHYSNALRISRLRDEPAKAAAACLSLGATLRRVGDLSGSVERLEEGLALLAGRPDAALEAELQYGLGLSMRDAGDRSRAEDCLERAITVGRAAYGEDHPRVGKYRRAARRLTLTEPG